MKFFLPYLIIISPFLSSAQGTAKVDITFENARYYRIEAPSFYKKFQFNRAASQQLLDPQQFIRAYVNSKPGDESQSSDRFILDKKNDNHYILYYQDNRPGVVYINQRPILVSPGDNVSLVYKMLVWDYNNAIDTLIATGNNAKNYTFSNFFNPKLIKGHKLPDLRDIKYQTNALALYDDLVKAYDFRDAYYDLYLKKYGYDNGFGEYIKRANHIEFLFNAIRLETELANKYKNQWPAFANKVHDAFIKTNFFPADTNYTYRMEEVFYSFFWHLTHAEFYPMDSQKNFDSLLNYINKYPNPFVKEYFLFFLIADYNTLWKNFRPADIIDDIKGIKNPAINSSLKNYHY